MRALPRQLLLAVLLPAMAGFVGVWVGSRSVQPDAAPPAPLRMAVDELTRRGLMGLTAAQKARIDEVELRYSHKRVSLRTQIAAANSQLADALAQEAALGPKVEKSIVDLKGVVGDLQRETVAYVLELRAVLTAQQQAVFDEKVVAALMSPPA
jgi:nickel and cobalt resistance protein CnrR